MSSTATVALLRQIDTAYSRSEPVGHYTTWSSERVKQVAEPAMNEANRLNQRNAPFHRAIRAAELYGTCAAIAIDTDFHHLEVEAKSRYAQLLAWTVTPNRDESRLRASQLFFELGELCIKRNDNEFAAISLTNGALCLLEMSNPTNIQLLKAKDVCKRTIRMRRRGSVDYGYSEMNLALAERKTIGHLKTSERILALANILRALDRAIRVLKKHDEAPAAFRSIYHQNVIEVLSDWAGIEIERSKAKMYEKCVPENINPELKFGISRRLFVDLLISNPAVVDYLETPTWVPQYLEILTDATKRVKPIWTRLEAASKFSESSPNATSGLRVATFQLQSLLLPLVGVPDVPIAALDTVWNEGNYETYFTAVAPIVTWEHSKTAVHESDYLTILRRIAFCLLEFRKTWSATDVERLLKRNPHTFRFAACELAHRGLWEDAFRLLESSRGLISSQTLNDDPSQYEAIRDDVSWVHLTHSPVAAYAIVRRDNSYSGAAFPELSGKSLTAEFHNVARGGILSAQDRRRSQAVESVSRIEQKLHPVSDWIRENTGERIALMPGGYFQSFPVAATGSLGVEFLEGRKTIVNSPSRAVNYRHKYVPRIPSRIRTASLQKASDVPGHSPLKWSRYEPAVLKEALSSKIWEIQEDNATAEGMKLSLRESDIVHFTGHSKSEFEASASHLVTYGQSISIPDILRHQTSSSMVVLGSCESALAHNEDEMLSLQTATYYSGAKFVIGTTWSIMDPVGLAFSAIFYDALRLLGAFDAERIDLVVAIDAHAFTLKWLRDATISEVNALFSKLNAPPIAPNGTLPAFKFYDWAAFTVIGIAT